MYTLIYSNKGTFYVLCAPSVVHADPEVTEKYSMLTNSCFLYDAFDQIVVELHCVYCAAVQKLFHEAGFDAFCTGFSKFMNN